MGTLKTLPGVVDTSARDAPGWGSVSGLTINGQTQLQLLVRRHHEQGHRLELEQLRRAGARFDRRSQGAGVELPGRVRPHLGRDDRRRHQERQPDVPAGVRPTSAATRTTTRTAGIAAAACDAAAAAGTVSPNCEKPRYRYDNTAYTIGGPVLIPGTDFNKERNKLFFFWSQDILPRNDPGGLQQQHDADGARAQRRLLPDGRDQRHRASGSRTRIASRTVWRAVRRPAVQAASRTTSFRGSDQLDRARDAEHVPDAERDRSRRHAAVQQPVRGHRREAAPGSGAAGGLERRRPNTTFYSRVQFGHEVCARGYVASGCPANLFLNTNFAQMQNSYDIDTFGIVEHAVAHDQPDDGARSDGRPELLGADRLRAEPGASSTRSAATCCPACRRSSRRPTRST